MDDITEAIVSKLKASKQQGLTYYQATQQLLQSGYTQAQIEDAADDFNYNQVAPDSSEDGSSNIVPLPNVPQNDKPLDESYEKLGNSILQDKERSSRPYAYVGLSIPAGLFAMAAYRLWLTVKFWGNGGLAHGTHYLLIYNLGTYLLFGALGAGLAIVGLKIYFGFKDRKYKKED